MSKKNDKGNSKGKRPSEDSLQPLAEKIQQLSLDTMRALVVDACALNRDLVMSKLVEGFLISGVGINKDTTEQNSTAWRQVRSLSEIRKLVGGRFQNLKNRWVAAGFPLREHRGDTGGKYEVDQQGWNAFRAWILEHGYEARLVEKESAALFEIRETSRRH